MLCLPVCLMEISQQDSSSLRLEGRAGRASAEGSDAGGSWDREDPMERCWLGLGWIERPAFAELVACSLAALAYVATLSFGFVYDDAPQILKNPAVRAWRFVPQYFTAHVWAAIYPNSAGNYYRPIFLLWLRINYALFGTNAWGWHLTSVACHVTATWLVFRLVRQLAGDRALAFAAAMIFAVHPAHVENVAWISGVTDPLMACFVLGSFSFFLSFQRRGGVWRAALSLAFFGLGLFTKETAVVLPGLVLAYLLFAERGERSPQSPSVPSPMSRSWEALGGLLVVASIYFGARFHALRGWSHSTAVISWKEVFLTWPGVLWFYAKHLVWPVGLSEFYPLDYVSRYTAGAVLRPLAFVLASALAAGLVMVFIRGRLEKKLAWFALALTVVPLLPVLDLRSLTAGDIVHDRYLYLPSVGLALLLALVLRKIAQGARPSGGEARIVSGTLVGTTEAVPVPEGARTQLDSFSLQAKLAAGFVAVLTVVFGVLTISQEMSWASDILLYTRGLESAPANLTVRDNLANALMEANQPERAIPLYLEVLRRNPAFWRSDFNLGFAYYKTGNFSGAEEYLQRAIRIDPGDPDEYIYLALADLQLKKLDAAEQAAGRAIALDPHARGYHSVAAIIDQAAGDRVRAAAEFKTEIAEHPDNAAAVAALQKLEEHSPAR